MSVHCPSCRAPLVGEMEVCPHCGFGFSVLDHFYTSQRETKTPLEASLLTDKAGLLNSSERKECLNILKKFSTRFPGLFFAVYLDSSRVHEVADSKCLWLMNKAHFKDLPEGAHPQYGILLYIDANKKATALSFGDGLESVLEVAKVYSFLSGCYSEFYSGRYLNAIEKVVSKTSSYLSLRCRSVKKSSKPA